MNNFEQEIENLDLRLFGKIESQSDDDDKQSLLACQLAVRNLRPNYNYLEIGSYLGGSIQPYLLDEKCARVFSIDKRPPSQPDERGATYSYLNNSTARMLENLKRVAPVDKITTIDGDTRGAVKSEQINEKIQLCFIDGEHTDGAAFSDFRFCLDVLDANGAIVFHDAPTVYNGIAECIAHLEKNKIKFRAYSLPAVVFAVEIGDFPLHESTPILERLLNNHRSYIYSLQYNDYYRRFANRKPFRFYRSIAAKLKGINKFD